METNRENRATTVLAEWIAGVTNGDVPDRAYERARVHLLDTLAAGVYGASLPAAGVINDSRALFGATADGDVPVWGRSTTTRPDEAALVNGTQAHGFELDDYYPEAKLHPGVVVVPAIAAAAHTPDANPSGEDLLRAMAIGYEVIVRASRAASANAVRTRGWHLTGVVGPLGAAAAVSALRGYDAATTRSALGIAASCGGGIFAFSREGAMTKALHAGRAASSGLRAADWAGLGFIGPSEPLFEPDGGLLRALGGQADVDKMIGRLGEDWVVETTAIKPYPCCGSLHSSIDAAIDIRAQLGGDVSDIRRVLVRNSSVVARQCHFPYSGEGGPLEAQMNIQFVVAAGLLDGQVNLRTFEPERRRAKDVMDLVEVTDFEVDPGIEEKYPATYPAIVEAQLSDGRTVVADIDNPRGSAQYPLDWDGVAAKAHDLVTLHQSAEFTTALIDGVADMRHADAARDILSEVL